MSHFEFVFEGSGSDSYLVVVNATEPDAGNVASASPSGCSPAPPHPLLFCGVSFAGGVAMPSWPGAGMWGRVFGGCDGGCDALRQSVQ